MDVPPSVLAFWVVRALTGSPGLVCRESTGLVSTAFTDDPLARFALVSSACAVPAALPCAPAPERSAATAPWPEVWAPALFCAHDVAANSSAVAARQSGPEGCRISIAMISSAVGLGRPKRARLAEDSQASNCFQGLADRQLSVACDPVKAICSVPRGTQVADRALEDVPFAARSTVAKHAQDAELCHADQALSGAWAAVFQDLGGSMFGAHGRCFGLGASGAQPQRLVVPRRHSI